MNRKFEFDTNAFVADALTYDPSDYIQDRIQEIAVLGMG